MHAMTSTELYLRLLRHVKPYWRMFLLGILGMVVYAATTPVLPALAKPLIEGTFIERDPVVMQWLPVAIVLLFVVRGLGVRGLVMRSLRLRRGLALVRPPPREVGSGVGLAAHLTRPSPGEIAAVATSSAPGPGSQKTGLYFRPSRRTSKWRWGAVVRPVLPTVPITCPRSTHSPTRTWFSWLCA